MIMRTLGAAWFAVLLACGSARADDAAEVERAFAALRAAVAAKDAAVVERLVDPGYVFFHGLGEVDTRAVFLNKMRAGRLARQVSEVTEYEPAIRVFGDTAVRSWVVRFRRPDLGIDDWGRGTAVLARRDGAWRFVSQQTGTLHTAPTPPPEALAGYAGRYEGPRRRFVVSDRGDYLHLLYDDGVEAYAFPSGGGVFGMGGGLTLTFETNAAGEPLRAVRRFGEREFWRAERVAR
jgi:hypothetical protein